MLTDEDLRQLVEEAAAAAPSPALLDVAAFTAEPKPKRVRSVRPAVAVVGVAAAAFVAVLIGASLFSSGSNSKSNTAFSTVANSIGGGAPATTVPAQSSALGELAPYAPSAPGASGAAGAAGATAAAGTAAPAPAPAPTDTAKVIKNGTLEIGVGKGTV